MPPTLACSSDAKNVFEDLSGVDITLHSNPYDALIIACDNDPHKIQALYSAHRTTRNTQQRAKLLSPEFTGLIIDQVLERLEKREPGYVDPRHCLVFWARPPVHIRCLVGAVQQKLRNVAPSLWIMPQERLHLTALEVTHSLTDGEIKALVKQMESKIPEITDWTNTHRARLIKPMLSFDGAALALSFLPAAGEALSRGRSEADDTFTYHHLRRDLYTLSEEADVKIESRYVVPSSHITVGRFLTQDDHVGKMNKWIEAIEEINAWLEHEYWPKEDTIVEGGEWIVGQEKGLDCREGTVWYGGGQTVRLGKGF